jgi:UDP-glucose 4-epimerase
MRVKDARQTFLGIWIRNLIEGRALEVWGGAQLRDFTYVDDAVQAFLMAAVHPAAAGKIYNIGGCEVVSLQDLAALLVQVYGSGDVRLQEFPGDRKRIDIGDYYADSTRITTELGWVPRMPLHEGLGRTLAFYREHLPHYL